MKEQFRQYIINLYHDIPQEVYEGLLSIFCIGLVVFIAWKGFKTGLRYSAPLLLVRQARFADREYYEHHSIHSCRNDTWFTIKG